MAEAKGDLTTMSEAELRVAVEEVRGRMRPVEEQLSQLRAERDLLLTELRRRERLATRERRTDVRDSIKTGAAVALREFVGTVERGEFEEFRFNLKSGGEVRLGFPGARAQTITWTDGRQVAQARSFEECARYFNAGWEMGAPGKPGVRVHFPGTRQERLVEGAEIFVSSA